MLDESVSARTIVTDNKYLIEVLLIVISHIPDACILLFFIKSSAIFSKTLSDKNEKKQDSDEKYVC